MQRSQCLSVGCAIAFLMAGTCGWAGAWHVKAGADGQGNKDALYGDSLKAIEKAVRSDLIRVAGGACNVKGGSGHFVVYAAKADAFVAGAEEASTLAGASKTYAEVAFDSFKKGEPGTKELAGKPVQFKAGLGQPATTWLIKTAPREDYTCVKLLQPGEPDATRNCMFGHILKGSTAAKEWDKLFAKREKYNTKGVVFKGTVWYLGSDNYAFPVAFIVDEIKQE